MTDYARLTTSELEVLEDGHFREAMAIAADLDTMTTTDPGYRTKRDAFARHRRQHQAIAATLHARRGLDMAAAMGSDIIAKASDPAPRGLASCGHPADEDGECSCSYWPEKAPHV